MKNLTLFSLLIVFLAGCVSYEEVEMMEVTNIGIKDINQGKIEIAVGMRIKHPNTYKISVVDSDLDLYMDGKKSGKAHIKEKVTLPKKSSDVHNFTVVAKMDNILSSGLPALAGILANGGINIKVKGAIKGRAKSISKTFPVEFSKRVNL